MTERKVDTSKKDEQLRRILEEPDAYFAQARAEAAREVQQENQDRRKRAKNK